MKKEITYLIITLMVGCGNTHATTFAIGDAIDGTPVILSNGTSVSGSIITGGGGTGTAALGQFGPGTNLGGPYDGTVFTGTSTGNASTVTRLATGSADNIDVDAGAAPYSTFIGFHVQFSQPTAAFDFFTLDLDGANIGIEEWKSVLAFSGGTAVAPAVSLASTTNVLIENETTPASLQAAVDGVLGMGVATVPTTLDYAYDNNGAGNEDPQDPATQVRFDFGGQEITDFFILYGVRSDAPAGTAGRNSGITGLTVLDPPVPVPEPSSTVLLSLFGLTALTRRKRSN